MKIFIVVLMLSVLLVSGCGHEQNRGTNKNPPPILPEGNKVTLMLFGAPWCKNCSAKIPVIDSILRSQPPGVRKNLEILFYVTTDSNGEEATQEIADRYREHLGLQAKAYADPWRWTTFRKHISRKELLPGAAVFNAKGEKIKVYNSCDTCFVPEEIASFVISQIKVVK